MIDEPTMIEKAEWKARCFVSPMRFVPALGRKEPLDFEWHQRFRGHPWVEQSITEDWQRELRTAVRWAIKQNILTGKPYDIIEDLMPPAKWVENTKFHAARYMRAAQWREKTIAEYGSVDNFLRGRKPGKSSFRPAQFDKIAFDALTKSKQLAASHDSIDPDTGEVLP